MSSAAVVIGALKVKDSAATYWSSDFMTCQNHFIVSINWYFVHDYSQACLKVS